MPRVMTVAELSPLVRSRRSLVDGGWTQREVDRAVREGRLHVIRRGWTIEASEWAQLWPEGRHLAHVIAVARDTGATAVMSHVSSAVVRGMEIYGLRPGRVHMTSGAPTRISSSSDVLRHVAPLPASDVEVVDGIRCTTLARTVFDTVRTVPLETAVVIADAAERRMGIRLREWDEQAIVVWRRGMAERLDAAAGARGVIQARWVAAFANGRADRPLESVARLQVHRLGFAPPRVQVRVPKQGPGFYDIDLGLDDADAWLEIDGRTKYLDEARRSGRTLEEVLLAEKIREDWIRGTTGRPVLRAMAEHIATPSALASRLAAFGILPPAL